MLELQTSRSVGQSVSRSVGKGCTYETVSSVFALLEPVLHPASLFGLSFGLGKWVVEASVDLCGGSGSFDTGGLGWDKERVNAQSSGCRFASRNEADERRRGGSEQSGAVR